MGKKIVLKVTLPGIDDPLAFKNRRFFGKLFFWGLCCANKIVAISRELVELSHLAGIPDKQVQLIFNGIDALRFSSVSAKEKFEIRRVLGINENAFVFMSIGTIEYRKGYDLLLAAYCRILKKIPNAELIIIGPGNVDSNNYYKELISYIDKFNLKNVKFSGKQFGIDDYLKSADCFLFCSRQEGFGTVIIESMSCGIPTVAMNIPCVTADIITDERIGVICYSGVANDFADLTLNFLNRIDEALLQDAASRVQAKYSIDKIADEYILIYEYILSLK